MAERFFAYLSKKLFFWRKLTDDAFLYLQENYVVTDGIFIDENIIFDDVTSEWFDFCQNTLEFEIPVYEAVEVAASGSKDKAES